MFCERFGRKFWAVLNLGAGLLGWAGLGWAGLAWTGWSGGRAAGWVGCWLGGLLVGWGLGLGRGWARLGGLLAGADGAGVGNSKMERVCFHRKMGFRMANSNKQFLFISFLRV